MFSIFPATVRFTFLQKKRCRMIIYWHWHWLNWMQRVICEQITWRHAQNVVSLRVLCKFVNFDSTRGSCGRDRCGSWIYSYICNQCLSPLTFWVWISLRRGVLDKTLCDKVCQWRTADLCFFSGSSTNKTDRHDTHFTEILLKVTLNTITLGLKICFIEMSDAFITD